MIDPVQSDLHPILSDVLPSSHTSDPTTLPSPQIGVQVEDVKAKLFVQVHPVSTWHVDEHPSLMFVFPSSHCSEGVMYPSLHCCEHVEAVDEDPPDQ